MSFRHEETSRFSAIQNMLLFRKTLEWWRLPGYPVARSRTIRFAPNNSLCVHTVLLLTTKIINFTFISRCLNANMDTINCPYSLWNFTTAIFPKFTDYFSTFFSRQQKFNEICCMTWKFFTKVMNYTDSSRFGDTKCLASTSTWVSSCQSPQSYCSTFFYSDCLAKFSVLFQNVPFNETNNINESFKIYTEVLFKWFLEVFQRYAFLIIL